jgi:hypothetical protein
MIIIYNRATVVAIKVKMVVKLLSKLNILNIDVEFSVAMTNFFSNFI